jgi:hypothetical protein
LGVSFRVDWVSHFSGIRNVRHSLPSWAVFLSQVGINAAAFCVFRYPAQEFRDRYASTSGFVAIEH